jgi:recombination protein RecR
MNLFPLPLQKLIRDLSKLPSIGEKSATRLAYHLVSKDKVLAGRLATALREVTESVHLCRQCFFLTEEEHLCPLCRNPHRDSSLLCIVEKPMDVISIERLGDFRGYYHVLHGVWAPLRGINEEEIRLKELFLRLDHAPVKEVIVATGSTVEGDATAMYIANHIVGRSIICTRLAQGMPKGGDLEYTDEITLSRAFAGRSNL